MTETFLKPTEAMSIEEALEFLASQCPWDTVDIWVSRRPEGELTYTAYCHDNEKLGFGAAFGYGPTPGGAAFDLLTKCGRRDPELARNAKIKELEEKIQKLKAVVISFPPYVPNRELAQHITRTVNVEASNEN